MGAVPGVVGSFVDEGVVDVAEYSVVGVADAGVVRTSGGAIVGVADCGVDGVVGGADSEGGGADE